MVNLTKTRDLSEDELLTLAQKRDEAAFGELMSRNSSSSFKLALSILQDRQDAEDEVQNSYWNAWRYVGQFQRGSKFSTWMSRIVINQCLMRLRKNRKASFLYLDEGTPDGAVPYLELSDSGSTPEVLLGDKELSALLHREIHRLPSLFRSILVLRDLNEMSMADGCPTVDRDDVRVILLRSPLAHPAVDEPLSDAGHFADHRNFVESDLRFIVEVSAKPADPRFHSEARIVGEAQRNQGDAARSGVWQSGGPTREKLALQNRHGFARGKKWHRGASHQDQGKHIQRFSNR